MLATDEFWPTQGGKAPDISQVKNAIDAILATQRDRNSSSKWSIKPKIKEYRSFPFVNYHVLELKDSKISRWKKEKEKTAHWKRSVLFFGSSSSICHFFF